MSTPSAFPLVRNIQGLEEEFDVLVVGGGIYGAWSAYDAALRGLKVALIEMSDWASGTSSASSKLIHGGLRYLEHYEFGLVRHALKERRTLSRIAPLMVRPLDFIMPVWKGPRASPLMLSAGLTLYDTLAFGSGPVKSHKHFRTGDLLSAYPFIDPERLISGFRYGDCQEDDARMTMIVVAAAQGAGAVCANRVKAEGLLRNRGTVYGARVRDEISGETFEVHANCVVNTTGPWTAALIDQNKPKVKLIKGTHLLLPRIEGCKEAFLLTAQDGRVFFVIPWYGRTIVGTTEAEVESPDVEPTDEETSYLIDGVRRGLPGLGWTESDVIARYCGVRTLMAEEADSLAAVSREFEITRPEQGLIAPIGGKYTTSRCDAIEIVDAVQKSLGRPRRRSETHELKLPGVPEQDNFDLWLERATAHLSEAGVNPSCAYTAAHRHGTRFEELLTLIRQDENLARPIEEDVPFIRAEIVLAFRDEMAISTEDALRRRMPLELLVSDPQAARLDAEEIRQRYRPE